MKTLITKNQSLIFGVQSDRSLTLYEIPQNEFNCPLLCGVITTDSFSVLEPNGKENWASEKIIHSGFLEEGLILLVTDHKVVLIKNLMDNRQNTFVLDSIPVQKELLVAFNKFEEYSKGRFIFSSSEAKGCYLLGEVKDGRIQNCSFGGGE